MLVPVKGYKHTFKDLRSGGIINTDSVALQEARERKIRAANKNKEMEDLKNRVQGIEEKLDLVISLLSKNESS